MSLYLLDVDSTRRDRRDQWCAGDPVPSCRITELFHLLIRSAYPDFTNSNNMCITLWIWYVICHAVYPDSESIGFWISINRITDYIEMIVCFAWHCTPSGGTLLVCMFLYDYDVYTRCWDEAASSTFYKKASLGWVISVNLVVTKFPTTLPRTHAKL